MEPLEGTGYHLPLKPEYPAIVQAVCIAPLAYDTVAKRLYFEQPEGHDVVASLWIIDGPWRVDMAVVLRDGELRILDCFADEDDMIAHPSVYGKLEELERAFLESEAFRRLREDIWLCLIRGLHTLPLGLGESSP